MRAVLDFLTIIAWNIYIGTSIREARVSLRKLIKEYNPEIFALMEASKLYEQLDGLGYEVIQLKPKPLREGNQPGQGNIALLIRDDIEIVKRKALRMTTFWIGPKHGWPQDPRVYRWVKIRWQGRIWKVGAAHTPFGAAAREESRRKLVRWLRRVIPGRPTVLVMDANMLLPEFQEGIANPGGAKATGFHIELTAYKNCRLISKEKLPKGPSDHPPVVYDFVAN